MARMTPLDALGPFFAVETLDEARTSSSGWTPLVRDMTDPAFVDAWVGRAWARVGDGLAPAPSDRRALGAVLHLGVVARLTSPWIGRFLIAGDARVPDLDALWWRDDGTTLFPLAHRASREDVDESGASSPRAEATTHRALFARDGVVEAFAHDLLRHVISPLDASGFTASAAIRRGNAASAINTATGMVIRQTAPSSQRHDVGRHLVEVCVARLGRETPARRGDVLSSTFRRTSCCLAYALPGGSRASVCGDCVLRP